MKTKSRSYLALLTLGAAALMAPACAKTGGSPAAAGPAQAEPARYPLKGVIVEVQPDQSALLVKHEDIPGLMPAMTMLFKVDAATLKTAVKGRAITATVVRRDDGFSLENVKPTQ